MGTVLLAGLYSNYKARHSEKECASTLFVPRLGLWYSGSTAHSHCADGGPIPPRSTTNNALEFQRHLHRRIRGEKRIPEASQGRSASARGGVAEFFSRKISVTDSP